MVPWAAFGDSASFAIKPDGRAALLPRPRSKQDALAALVTNVRLAIPMQIKTARLPLPLKAVLCVFISFVSNGVFEYRFNLCRRRFSKRRFSRQTSAT